MEAHNLPESESDDLQKKLHHAHDKMIRIALFEEESLREFSEKIIMPKLKGIKIDLNNLKLDSTTYTGAHLQAFYADIVYLTTMIDETTGEKELVNVALLIEHKSKMPKQLQLRLQISDYINGIMKRHYDEKTDTTIPVLSIIFNQFDKGWKPKTFRSLFPKASDTIALFIPEFALIVINLADLPKKTINSLDKYGTLKAALLAMKHVRNKKFLIEHFQDIFLFLQGHPHKTDLKSQIVTYLVGESGIHPDEMAELLKNIFSPVLKHEVMMVYEGFMAVTDRKARAEEKAIARADLQLKTRLSVMRGWNRGVALDTIILMADLSKKEVVQLIAAFEKAKDYCYATKDIDKHL